LGTIWSPAKKGSFPEGNDGPRPLGKRGDAKKNCGNGEKN